jgi:hypothetical protein
VSLPSGTWTTEGPRLAHLPEVFDIVASAYLAADEFNKDIATRQAIAKGKTIGVIPEDGIADLRLAIDETKDALRRL